MNLRFVSFLFFVLFAAPAFAQDSGKGECIPGTGVGTDKPCMKQIMSIKPDPSKSGYCVELNVKNGETGVVQKSSDGTACEPEKKVTTKPKTTTKKPGGKKPKTPAVKPGPTDDPPKTSTPTDPPKTTTPTDTITIEISSKEWELHLKQTSDLLELYKICGKDCLKGALADIEKLEAQVGIQPDGAQSIEMRLMYLFDRDTKLDSRLTVVEQKVEDHERRLRLLEQESPITGLGHQFGFLYGYGLGYVDGEGWQQSQHLLGATLRLGLNPKIGIQGGFAVAPRLTSWSDLQWSLGLDSKVREGVVLSGGAKVNLRSYDFASNSIGDLEAFVSLGAEVQVLKSYSDSTWLLLQGDVGGQGDGDQKFAVGGFVGLKHVLWSKHASLAGKPADQNTTVP